jgi:hydroxymethylpyrimidine/phosphomethylpyrimidine kinase
MKGANETGTAIAVTIAGSDSGGGAGIQADLKTFSALGVYGASVVTALTAQNTVGVQGIHDVPPAFVAAQMDSVFSDLSVDAVKIGMLSRPDVIEAVAEGLKRHGAERVVLDPVMVAASGDRLLAPDAIDTLRRVLIPRALLVTPNLPEAAALLDEPVAGDERRCGRKASASWPSAPARCWSRAGMPRGPRASTC